MLSSEGKSYYGMYCLLIQKALPTCQILLLSLCITQSRPPFILMSMLNYAEKVKILQKEIFRNKLVKYMF